MKELALWEEFLAEIEFSPDLTATRQEVLAQENVLHLWTLTLADVRRVADQLSPEQQQRLHKLIRKIAKFQQMAPLYSFHHKVIVLRALIGDIEEYLREILA